MEQTVRENNKTLYSPKFEHDNCGIGAVVNIKGIKSHDTVANALTIVETLEHRAPAATFSKMVAGRFCHHFLPGVVDPLCVLAHKGVRLFQAGAQRDADHHGAVVPYPQMQLFDLFAVQLVLDAARAAQLDFRFLCGHVRTHALPAAGPAAGPAPRRQRSAHSPRLRAGKGSDAAAPSRPVR